MVLLIIVLVVIVLIAAGVIYARNRSTNLRERFGPEYDRAVEEQGGRRRAEASLRAVAKRRARLEIAELSPESQERYRTSWRNAQARFVDAPVRALAEADALVGQVLRERGYPTGDVDEQVVMVAIDHPDRADDYRQAYAVHRGTTGQAATTDDLREAFLRYRVVFESLVSGGDSAIVQDEDGTVTRAEPVPVTAADAEERRAADAADPAVADPDERAAEARAAEAEAYAADDRPGHRGGPAEDGASADDPAVEPPAARADGATDAADDTTGLTPEEYEAEMARRRSVEERIASARGESDPGPARD